MNTLVHDTLDVSVKKFSKRKVLQMDGTFLTYYALHAKANKIAAVLKSVGVQKGERVGICMNKSLNFIVSIFGILQSDAIYVPLDRNSPIKRTKYIVYDCGIKTIIITNDKFDNIKDIVRKVGLSNVIVLSGDNGHHERSDPIYSEIITTKQRTVHRNDFIIKEKMDDNDIAAILYTSGTTGLQKGVMIKHKNIVTFVQWALDAFEISENDTLISHAPFHFDLSLFDIFAAIAAGACTVIVPHIKSANPKYLVRLLANKISIWQSVPSALILMAEYGELERYGFEKYYYHPGYRRQ